MHHVSDTTIYDKAISDKKKTLKEHTGNQSKPNIPKHTHTYIPCCICEVPDTGYRYTSGYEVADAGYELMACSCEPIIRQQ